MHSCTRSLNDSNSQAVYNENHVLVLAQMHNFKQGVIYLYERANMYNEILEYHMERNEYADILLACKRHGYGNTVLSLPLSRVPALMRV
mgnify:CR=1 FL=1